MQQLVVREGLASMVDTLRSCLASFFHVGARALQCPQLGLYTCRHASAESAVHGA